MDLITTSLDGHGVWFYENPLKISTKDFQLEASLKLTPNPTPDFLNFELTADKQLNQLVIAVFDLTGQKSSVL